MRSLRLWQKIVLIFILSIALLAATLFFARLTLLNNIVNHYLPEGSTASIGIWPLELDGVGFHNISLNIPDTIQLTVNRVFIGTPSLSDQGYKLASLTFSGVHLVIPNGNPIEIQANRLHLQDIGLDSTPNDNEQTADTNDQSQSSTINYIISAQHIELSGAELTRTEDDITQHITLNTTQLDHLSVDLSAITEQQSTPKISLNVFKLSELLATLNEHDKPTVEVSINAARAGQLLINNLQDIHLKDFSIDKLGTSINNIARQVNIETLSVTSLSNTLVPPPINNATASKNTEESQQTQLQFSSATLGGIDHNFDSNHPLFNEKHPLFTQDALTLKAFKLVNTQQLFIEQIVLDNSFLNVELDPNGQLNLVELSAAEKQSKAIKARQKRIKEGAWSVIKRLLNPKSSSETTNSETTSGETLTENFQFSINSIDVNNGFAIRFKDQSQKPPVKIQTKVIALNISDINNFNPITKSKLDLAMSIAPKAQLTASAHFNLLNNNHFKSSLDLKHLSLPLISAYVESSIGYAINTGQLNTQLNLTAHRSKLDGHVSLKLIKLDIKLQDKAKAEKGSKALNMPIETAVNTLKNKYGDIELNTAIKGSLDDPDFNIGKFTAIILAKATKEQTRKLLSLAVSPVGWVTSSVFGKSPYKQLTSLPPIEFKDQETSLSKKDKTLIKNIAVLLEEQAEFNFALCAVVSANEAETIKERERLALARKKNTIKALRKAGVNSNRWVACKDELNDAKGVSIVYFRGK